MARLGTSGAESRLITATVARSGEPPFAATGTVGINTGGNARTGEACFSMATGGANFITTAVAPASTARNYYGRAAVKFSDATPAAAIRILAFYTSTTAICYVQLNTDGTLSLYDKAGVIGTTAATLVDDTYAVVELAVNLPASGGTNNGYVEARLNGSSFAASSAANTGITVTTPSFRVGQIVSVASSSTMYVDDVAINDDQGAQAQQKSWPGNGYVDVLWPTADSSVGGSWQAPQTTGADTTNIYDAVDNRPPGGVAHSDVDANNLKYIFDAASETAAYDATCENYTTAGVGGTGVIQIAQAVFRLAGDSATGTNNGSGRIVSNPADGADTTFTAGFDIVADTDGTSTAAWGSWRTTINYAPSVTLGTQPVIRINKITAATRAHMVDQAYLLFEYVSPVDVSITAVMAATTAAAPSGITDIAVDGGSYSMVAVAAAVATAPTVAVSGGVTNVSVDATIAAASAIGVAPAFKLDASITAAQAAATAASIAPAFTLDASIAATQAAATAAGTAPAIQLDAAVTATQAAATADAIPPAVSATGNVSVTAPAAAAAAAAIASTVEATRNAAITAVATIATAAGVAPSVSATGEVTIQPPPAVADASSATGSASIATYPIVGEATAAAVAPTITATGGVAITAVPAAATASAPELAVDLEIGAAQAAATAAGIPPTVTGTGAVSITAVPATATAAGIAPTLTLSSTITAVPATAIAAGIAPSVAMGATIQAPIAAATAAGIAPTLTLSPALTAPAAQATAQGVPPAVTATTSITVAAAVAAATATGIPPTIQIVGAGPAVETHPPLDGTYSETIRDGVPTVYARGGNSDATITGGVVDSAVRGGVYDQTRTNGNPVDSLLGGVYDQTTTSGGVYYATRTGLTLGPDLELGPDAELGGAGQGINRRGGTVATAITGGIVDDTTRDGVSAVLIRGGTLNETVRGGVHDESDTGGVPDDGIDSGDIAYGIPDYLRLGPDLELGPDVELGVTSITREVGERDGVVL